MKTIKEIFEKNTQLLETKEVKELITQFHYQYDKIAIKNINKINAIEHIIMNSQLFVIKGKDFKQCIEEINEILF